MNVIGGTTDVTTYFVLRTAADGTALTGATITNIDLQYVRTGAAPSAKVDATALAATDSAHAANKAFEIDGTDAPGLYRVDWPDAAFAASVRQVVLSVKYATAFTEHMVVEIDPPVGVAASVTGACGSVTGAVGSVGAGGIVAATFGAGAITATVIAAAAIDNATFAADVGSTAYATNIVALSVRKALDEIKLDHLVAVADADDVVNDSVIAKLAATAGDWSTFSDTTDSLQSIRDVAPHGSAMAGTDGANTAVPDVAGTAAGLHATTDGKIDTVDSNVDAILLDTGTDGVVLKAAGLNADAVTEIVAGIWASTGWDSTTTMGFGDAAEILWAVMAGNIARTSDAYAHKGPDDSTTIITLTAASGNRTRS